MLLGVCWEYYGSMEYWSHLCMPSGHYTTCSRGVSALSAVSQACSQLVLNSTKAILCHLWNSWTGSQGTGEEWSVSSLGASGWNLLIMAKCEATGMRVWTSISEALVVSQKEVDCPLRVRREFLPQVQEFTYLGVLFTSKGRSEHEIGRWISRWARPPPSPTHTSTWWWGKG